jgi:2-hydroxy-6-oxonona-2,4-dienedioate hydrolase
MAREILLWIAALLIVVLVFIVVVYYRDMNRAYERVRGKSFVVASPYGDIEYTDRGSGPPVLVIHGSGGGFDQGELIAQAVLGDRFRSIIPSRFGYLRSTFHEGATFDDQAHAYACLLDTLGIDKVAVVTLSHGGPSSLLFAALHPERVSSLTLISAGVASSPTQNQEQANQKGDMLTTIYKYDPLYWGVTKLFRKQFMKLMGANDDVIAGLSAEQRTLIDHVIDFMNPVSPRSAGVNFDNKAVMPNERIAGISAPTLILHATDDALQLFHNAEFADSAISGAQLVRFKRGGHFLIAVEQSAIRAHTQKHILDHTP